VRLGVERGAQVGKDGCGKRKECGCGLVGIGVKRAWTGMGDGAGLGA